MIELNQQGLGNRAAAKPAHVYPNPPAAGQLLTLAQVADRLNVSLSTARRLVKGLEHGPKLPALKVGRVWRVRPADLDAWVEKQKRPTTAEARDRSEGGQA